MDRILYLRSLPMISQLSIEQLALLAEHLEERYIRQGQVVIPIDRPVETIEFVVSGLVRTSFNGATIARVEPPFGVGYMAALARIDRGYEAVAEVDTQTLSLSGEVFVNILEDDFRLVLDSIRTLSRQLLALRDRLPPEVEDDEPAPESTYTGQPLDLVERLVWVQCHSRVFENSNIDAVMEICQRQTERRWQQGDRIWSAGDRADFGISILQGRIRCWGDDGQRAFTAGVGFGLGFLDGLASTGRHVNAEAQGEVVGLIDEIETLVDVLEDNFDLSSDMLALLATNNLEVSALVGL